MKTNKILNIVILIILSNISANATSQHQTNEIDILSLLKLQGKDTKQEINSDSDSSNSDIDSSDFDITVNSRKKLYCNSANTPYKLIDLCSGGKGIFIKDHSRINRMYPNIQNKYYTGIFTTIDDFKTRYIKKIYNPNEICNINELHIKSTKRYYNNTKEIKKYLAESEQCDCIMCNRNKDKRIYDSNDIEKYNNLVQSANEIASSFNKLLLVENNNRFKIQEFKNGLQDIDTKRNKNNIIQKEFDKLGDFINEINKKVTKLYKETNGSKLSRKRYRNEYENQDIKSNSESLLSSIDISNNKNNISTNNKNNIKDSNNQKDKDDLSISFSCLSPSSLSLYESSSED